MELADIKIEEIDDLSHPEAVKEVSDRASKKERNGDEGAEILFGSLQKKENEEGEGHRGNGEEKHRAKLSRLIRKKTKGGAWIPNIGQRKEIVDHDDRFVQTQNLLNMMLGELIENDNAPPDQSQEKKFI